MASLENYFQLVHIQEYFNWSGTNFTIFFELKSFIQDGGGGK